VHLGCEILPSGYVLSHLVVMRRQTLVGLFRDIDKVPNSNSRGAAIDSGDEE
jgi:hypothetical protein